MGVPLPQRPSGQPLAQPRPSRPGTRPQQTWRRRPHARHGAGASRDRPAGLSPLRSHPLRLAAKTGSGKYDLGGGGVLGGSGAAVVWLRAGAAVPDAVHQGEPVAGGQGAPGPLKLPSRLLPQPTLGLPGAEVGATVGRGARKPGVGNGVSPGALHPPSPECPGAGVPEEVKGQRAWGRGVGGRGILGE